MATYDFRSSFFIFINNCFTKFLVPDPCNNHCHEPHIINELFYNFGESSNNHPEPNLFNFIIILL
ncbi:hypothetical protein LX97_02754 [Nonlabens dokdonensis]|jgi:hypothetical protein|uniref:Uncharacterized protein n=1 Tax=Nonlabens dokdonensis TaxID=328515 RepID=A0ABX5PVH6_9FLAO|nr:hypothetical protein LX97_02754 [Nonlabens dokdonensis]